MKKVLLVFIFSFSIFHFAVAQNPLVKMWDRRYGGTNMDRITCFQQTSDKGYILGGMSNSGAGGDKTQPLQGIQDYWIVRLDSIGNKIWDKDFGGSDNERLWTIVQTNDRGFLLGGDSRSGIDGDKSQITFGGADFWIVKIDSAGDKEWDKDFGGTEDDYLWSIDLTNDGGYILGGISFSDSSGNKSQFSWGDADFWMVKIDSIGNKEWDKDFGGRNGDFLLSLVQTNDSGYILGGYSFSDTSGSKSQMSYGAGDYWIVKTDSVGIEQWDKDFGGTGSDYLTTVEQSPDGGFILSGNSYSLVSGNKTVPQWGDGDYWIIKTDSWGSVLWQKDFGGINYEGYTGNIFLTDDKGFLFTGSSRSVNSGDKTESNLGPEQSWVVKTDSLGNKQWDKTLFTPGNDHCGYAIQEYDGCFVFANYSDGNIGGYKTQSSQGDWDYWIVKLCDSSFVQANLTSSTSICPGSCIDFVNLSFNAIMYQWSFPGANPDSSSDINPTNICYGNEGTYDVQLIASNANGSDTLLLTNYITVYPSPPAQSITQFGDTLFSILGASSYQWYYDGNIITGATNYFYVATQSGNYNVVATDSNGCEVEAAINDVAASIQYTVDSKQFTIFPNPVDEELIIKNEKLRIGSAATISIYNLIGEKVLAVQLPTVPNLRDQLPTCSIDVSGLPPGMYWLDVSAEGKTFRAKFVKQ